MPFTANYRLPAKRTLVLAGICAGTLVVGMSPAIAAPAPAATVAASAQATGHVIVVLRDQHTNLAIAKGKSSARLNAYRSDQAPVLSRAHAVGVRNVHGFETVNAVAAIVTSAQAAQLAADPAVAAILPDLTITNGPAATAPTTSSAAAPVGTTPQSGICPTDPAKPLLEPEALQVTNTAFTDPTTPQAQNIVDGAGVKVAWIADGIDINNPDFIRANGDHVFIDYQDFSGDGISAPTGGEEAFGDASSIAAQGRQSYDLADYVNAAHPLPAGCNINIRGMAPGASLIGLKVFGQSNSAPTSRFIEAIDYAVAAGADVLNESFGGNPFPDTSDDPISIADAAAIAAGVTVVVSTGDAGTNGTIGSPSSAPNAIIGVGASTTFRDYLQEGGGGSQFSNGTWLNDNISGLSSGGTTQSGGVPDLVAPGDLGWSLCTADPNLYTECTNNNGEPSAFRDFGGTSESSPLVAGAAALVIEAYEQTHHGARPSPALVKRLLTSTATDLSHPASEQGAGLVNSLAAVKAAQSWKDNNGTPSIQGNALVVDKTQLRLSGLPAFPQAASITVTNVSPTAQTVSASTRSFEKVVSTVNGSLAIDATTGPFYIDAFGIARSYASTTFVVGKADRLDVSEAAATAPFASRIILIDPHGAFAAYSIPQGAANFAHIDVRFPTAGTWTAYFALSKSSSFVGAFAYSIVQTNMTTHGIVVPNKLTLAPGKSGTFAVITQLPLSPSDLSASVQFTGSGGATTSVPMTLRADIPPINYKFSGTITGGNGRANLGVAQSNVYYLDVPRGQRDISIGMAFSDPNELILATLMAPDGQVYSFPSNVATGATIQIYRRNPQAGQWVLSLEITNPVSGAEVTQKFTAQVAYNTVNVHASLPNSTRTKLPAGVAVTVPVTVKNTSSSPVTYFADPRRNQVGTLQLAELSGNSTDIPLPVPDGVVPFWLLPTESRQLQVNATADQPVNLDIEYESGDPERYGAANGNAAQVTVNAAQVSPGPWSAFVGQHGPFVDPATPGSVSLTATAVGQLFDLDVTSTTGDVWQEGVSAQSDAAIAAAVRNFGQRLAGKTSTAAAAAAAAAEAAAADGPLTLAPGQTGTIMVTITPSGPAGSVVTGNLYIDSFDFFTLTGDELVGLPYSYKIK